MEIWKDIKGYEGRYQISNEGRVKSLIGSKEKILKPGLNFHGYEKVTLSKGNKVKAHLVHRLVAQAFIPNPNDYPCINHKDEMKFDNSVDNLEWCTYDYNNNYGSRKLKIAETRVFIKDYVRITMELMYGKQLSYLD